MGSRASTLLREEELKEIKKKTGFSHSQITRFYSRFTSLDKGQNGTLSRDNEKSKDVNGPEPLNSRSNKLRFAFRLYDLDKDDKISRDELVQVLRMMVGMNISDEQLGSLADRTIREADQDGDSGISFTEFVKVLEKVDVEQKMSIQFLH
ncbi:Calcineurin B homologous protein 1 [Sciurus carolinensis]|uniref:Calcineurin B homologous protein 1 n=1 Tax=Sciurus carolinensis TaxID=30640 RepID=A0AA41N896_SCICA|nr:Calcineurin B homologous protein 1 [Sciurus carolinensis]